MLKGHHQDWLSQGNVFHETLLQDILPFWFPRCLDREHGGYFSSFDRRGDLIDSDKSVWAQGRMSWMLLSLFNRVEQNSDWLEWGQAGLDFLEQSCFDRDGRLFFHVARDGSPIRKRRYAFSESFAAIAYAAHYRATGASRSAERALQLYVDFMRWHFTPGLLPPKFEGTRELIGLGPYMIGLVTGQELRRNLGDEEPVTQAIESCLETILDRFVSAERRVVFETVGEKGPILEHFDGRLLNPGHAIEAGWFLMEEGQLRGDASLMEQGVSMVDWMWERGWDTECGGLFYFCDVEGKPVQEYWHEMKFWWPHNEGMIASLLAYTLADDKAIWGERFNEICRWSFGHFPDAEFGEWYGYLRRDGSISSELKGGLWKSFFHLPRALLICGELLGGVESSPRRNPSQ